MNKVIELKRSKISVVHQMVVIDASQARELEHTVKRLGMTKRDAFATALNIWLGMVNRQRETS